MAKATLPTNYRDDILNVSTEGKRKYRMNYNDDGTVSFVDVTPYDQEGSDFGAGDINATNEAVNQSFDKSKLIRDMDAISALTQEGYAPDALALKEVNNSLEEQPQFVYDENGKITGYKTKVGADTVFPFSSEITKIGWVVVKQNNTSDVFIASKDIDTLYIVATDVRKGTNIMKINGVEYDLSNADRYSTEVSNYSGQIIINDIKANDVINWKTYSGQGCGLLFFYT